MPDASQEHRRFTRAFQTSLLKAGLVSFTKRIGLNGTAHVCGSLVCGRSPSDSVVDAGGQVHGMTGLYVVDGSVLPRSSRVNPSLTIYAWGLKVADALVRRFQPAPDARSQVGSEAAYVGVSDTSASRRTETLWHSAQLLLSCMPARILRAPRRPR